METPLLFVNAAQVVTCAGAPRARTGAGMQDAAIRTGVAVLVAGRSVVAVDDERALRATHRTASVIDCQGGVLTPGFVDSHTHAVFGRARYEEQERRAAGASYQDIARGGGGIHASVRDLRARSDDDLLFRPAHEERVERRAFDGEAHILRNHGLFSKAERALVLMLGATELLVRGGERVALLGLTQPTP